jgi:hypothetical protein
MLSVPRARLLVPDRRLTLGEPTRVGQIVGGRFLGKIVRDSQVIDEFACENIVVNQGLNYLLGAGLGAQSVTTAWYIGLFSNNYTILSSDTAATISANAGETTQYTAGVRQNWSSAPPASQSITNSTTQASFTFNATVTVYGAFLISSSAINGTSGTLFSGAQFGSPKSVVNLDILLLTYTFTAASA